jgi:hypothetical protein
MSSCISPYWPDNNAQVSTSPATVVTLDSSTTEVLEDQLISPIPASQLYTFVVNPSHSSFYTIQSGSNYVTYDSSTNEVYYSVSPGTITNSMYWEYTALPAGIFQPEADTTVCLYMEVDVHGVPIEGSQLYTADVVPGGRFNVYSDPKYKGTSASMSEDASDVTLTPGSVIPGNQTEVVLYQLPNYEETADKPAMRTNHSITRFPAEFTIRSLKIHHVSG